MQPRFKALHALLYDIYHEERLFTDGVVPQHSINGPSASLLSDSHA
ncbi:MAG: hypothetical protein IMW91_04435 [Firmicutes bacterium]|nr:hypothetical protein [Bacillota bacterium]